MNPTILIIGASRGIGLELARQYAAAGARVHATTRNTNQPGRLGELPGDVHLHELEVRDPDHIAALSSALGDTALDLLIHNAGVHPRDHADSDVMEINARAPFAVVEPLLTMLERSANPRLVLVSSQLGARRGRDARLDTYGESKAQLNDRFRELAPAWGERGICGIVLHPGWVQTDMGGASAPVSVEESASGIRKLVDAMGPEYHGGFWTWQGRRHPW